MKTNLKARISIILLLGFNAVYAQNFEWAKAFGGANNDYGYSITMDVSGNVYTTGIFFGTVDFDPGTGTANLISAGSGDVFVQKLDASGNFLWAKRFGGSSFDEGYSITVDASGNVYTTGWFGGTGDFDPGAGTANLTSVGYQDIFVQKLDASGNFLWAKRFGGSSNERGNSITVDASGSVYTTGYFWVSGDFDPGAGTANLTSAGDEDVFIQKLDASGNFLWVKSFGGSFYDIGRSITVDASGNVYTTGYFHGTVSVDFDPGPGAALLRSGGNGDVFVQKLDASGNFLWAKSFGGSSRDEGRSITLDALGNVYTTGYFKGIVDFDPGAGTANLTSAGIEDGFVQKLDASGNFLWAKRFGGSSSDVGNSITVDASGNVYTAGYFEGTVDFDPGAGTANLTSAGIMDIFVQKLSASGNFLWAKSFGGSSWDIGESIRVDASGNVYTTGYFEGTVDFDPGAGTANITSAGARDFFVQKLSQCATNIGTSFITACDSYTWIDGITYTASNSTATHTLINAAGCDSVVTLNLTINNNTGTDVQTTCNSFIWIDGNTYTTSNNTATHTLTNAAGCDSVVTLNLTIKYPNSGTALVSACNSYIWIDGNTYTASNNSATYTLTNAGGCDSVVTLNLTINNSTSGTVNVSACDSYTWTASGATYTAGGTYYATLTNAAGCDSTIQLNLTIYTGINLSAVATDVSTCNAADGSITLNISSGTTPFNYIWNNGQTTQNLSNLTAGIYSVTVTDSNNCIVTTSVTVNAPNSISVTTVATDGTTCGSADGIIILNVSGGALPIGYLWSNGQTTQNLNNLAAGEYSVTVTDDNNCSATDSVTINTPPALNITAIATDISNCGIADGTITLNISGGTPPVRYTWSNGQTTNNLSNLTADTYSVTATDSKGCTATATSVVVDSSIGMPHSNFTYTLTDSSIGFKLLATNFDSFMWDYGDGATSNDTNAAHSYSANGIYEACLYTYNNCGGDTMCVTVNINISGVDDVALAYIKVYPNPASDEINIQSLNLQSSIAEVRLYDVTGRIVNSQQSTDHRYNTSIDVSRLMNGLYFLHIEISNGERVVRKVVKE